MKHDGLPALTPKQIALLRNGLRMMALRALGDVDEAEDVVQESLLRALDAVSAEIASDPVRLGAFVGGIARHVIADVRRREARTTVLPEGQPDSKHSDCLDDVVKAEERTRVVRALARLSSADQALLHASFYEGMTPGQIAFRTHQTPEAVRKRKSRALGKLRRVLEMAGHAAPVDASNNGAATTGAGAKSGP
jgi:RNA polymerase sigma factor (sigma-70 family)